MALVGFATGAHAASIVFSDRTQFNLAAQPDQFENFDGPTPPCVIVSTNCHLTYSGLTFVFDIADFPFPPIGPPPPPLGFINVGPFFPVFATFAPISAIGFDLGPLTAPFQVSVAPILLQPGGSVVTGPDQLVTTPGFLGFVGTEGTLLTGLRFTPDQTQGFGVGGSFASIDNVAVSVPEPTSLLLFAIAASAIAGGRRYRRS
jgi:hypothetical protein